MRVNAQNVACSISDLSVESYECDEDGMFLVDLSFEFEEVGESGFMVQGNGENYGDFEYEEMSQNGYITVGPLEGDGETFWEFIVIDLENEDCQDFVEFGVVECMYCHFEEVEAIVDCAGNLEIDFEYFDTTNEFFDLFIDGEFIDYYAFSDLPIAINAPEGAEEIKISENDNSACFIESLIDYEDCNDCSISNVFAEAYQCDEDGMFLIDLTFGFNNVGDEGFTVQGNGMNYGNFEYSEMIQNGYITLGPLEGDAETFWEFVVMDLENEDCQDFVEFGVVDCINCRFDNLEAVANCEGNITINFEYFNISNEFFDLFIDGALLDYYAFSDLPIVVNVPEGAEEINVSENDNLECFMETLIIYPDEEACPDSCYFENLVAIYDCDDVNLVEINFDAYHTTNTFFEVYVDDVFFNYYEYADLPITIGVTVGADAIKVAENDNVDCFLEALIEETLCNDLDDLKDWGIQVLSTSQELKIMQPNVTDKITMYQVSGQKVWEGKDLMEAIFISTVGFSKGLYILVLDLENGMRLSHKIIIE